MASREELDQRAQAGETVVPGGTGGKSLKAQEHLAEGMQLYESLVSSVIWYCVEFLQFLHIDYILWVCFGNSYFFLV